MIRSAMTSTNSDILASAKALRRAARRALELGLSTGTPVYVLKNGEIVDLTKQVRRGAHYTATPAVAAVSEPKSKYDTRSRPPARAKPNPA